MRTLLLFPTLLIMTPVFGLMVIIGVLFGAKDREGSIHDKAPRWWAQLALRVAGVRIRLHNVERMQTGEPRILRQQPRELVRRVGARRGAAALQVRRQGRAVSPSNLRPGGTRGGDDRHRAREPKIGVRVVPRCRGADPRRRVRRGVSRRHAWSDVRVASIQERPVRTRRRGGRPHRAHHRARNARGDVT